MEKPTYICAWCGQRKQGKPYVVTLPEDGDIPVQRLAYCKGCRVRVMRSGPYRQLFMEEGDAGKGGAGAISPPDQLRPG